MGFATDKWAAEEPAPPEIQLPTLEQVERSEARRVENGQLRERIKLRLWGETAHDLGNKLALCGLPFPLVCTHCGEQTVSETHCNRRWCPACSWRIAQKRLTRYSGAVALMADPLFITLTVENSDDPESLRKLRKDWSKMRRTKLIASKVVGGITAIEVTNQGRGWHPHLHGIIDCPWLSIATPRPHWSDSPEEIREKCRHAQAELCILWARACGQAQSVCWLKRVTGSAALAYTLAYTISGSDLADSPDPIAPLIRVIEKSRLISAFGNLYGRTAEMDGEDKPCAKCPCCESEKTLLPWEVVDILNRREAGQSGAYPYFREDLRA